MENHPVISAPSRTATKQTKKEVLRKNIFSFCRGMLSIRLFGK